MVNQRTILVVSQDNDLIELIRKMKTKHLVIFTQNLADIPKLTSQHSICTIIWDELPNNKEVVATIEHARQLLPNIYFLTVCSSKALRQSHLAAGCNAQIKKKKKMQHFLAITFGSVA